MKQKNLQGSLTHLEGATCYAQLAAIPLIFLRLQLEGCGVLVFAGKQQIRVLRLSELSRRFDAEVQKWLSLFNISKKLTKGRYRMNDKTDWAIEIDGLVEEYGSTNAVDHISFMIPFGVIFASLGPSAPFAFFDVLQGLIWPGN